MIRFVTNDNKTPEQKISKILNSVVQKLQKSGKLIQQSLKSTTQRHFQTIYPNSKHYSPSKVTSTVIQNGTRPSGSIDVDVPGVTRAYHDLDIKPRFRKHLAIPMSAKSYGKKASDFNDLIYIRKKNGNEFLAQNEGKSKLVFLFFLSKGVHQHQDRRLMPSDQTYQKNIGSRLIAMLRNYR